MDRIKVYLLADLARKGIVSLSRTPSTLLLMALNSPRMFEGASGLGSQMSRWLGPPWRKQRITDLAAPKPLAPSNGVPAALAFRAKYWGRLSPNKPVAPTRRNSRRVNPSQSLPMGPGMDSMIRLLRKIPLGDSVQGANSVALTGRRGGFKALSSLYLGPLHCRISQV